MASRSTVAFVAVMAGCSGGHAPAVRTDRSAQPATPELVSIDVYGTSDALAARIHERYDARLADCLAARTAGDEARSSAIRDEIVAGVRRLGDFAFAEASFVFGVPRDGKQVVHATIGVVETRDRGRRMSFAAAPARDLPDPGDLLAAWRRFEETGMGLIMSGKLSGERGECPAFHCIFDARGTELAEVEHRFVAEVPARWDALVEVLHQSRDPEARAAAAFLLAYGHDGARLVTELVPAIRDPDDGVRNNVMRVLANIAMFHPEVAIPVEPLVTALDFPSWSDRNKGALTLSALAQAHAEVRPIIIAQAGRILLALLRTQAEQTHDPALRILRLASGKSFGERDYAAWQGWLDGQAAP